jgi:Na+/H+ antiporter NhaD/arsenite permease-like protein|tara:strand:- start:5023 stop:6384 length:1362 start_codon:yes stop_codon:yes gene_type:complete
MPELSQVLAVTIFVAMFIFVVIGKVHRFIPALIGAAVTVIVVFLITMKSPETALSVLNLTQLSQLKFWIPGHETVVSHGVNWQTIIFIAGMMTMVESMAEVGFFNWLCLLLAKLVNYRIIPILISFMLLSGFLAMFIDSITVLLFMTGVTIELARLLKFDPVPVIIAMIFSANIGGAATMSGDPPNIIIGTAFGYTFIDFVKNTGVIAWAGMAIALVFFFFASRNTLTSAQTQTDTTTRQYPKASEAITNPLLFRVNAAIFILVIVLLITHAETGLSVAIIGVIAGALTLLAAFKQAPHIIRRIDWRTLLFFFGLFVTVGGLEKTGVLTLLAEYIGDISQGSLFVVIPIILWFSAFGSAVVDNIPFAATMVPVIANLSQTSGFPLPTLAWTLALGADIGGNATPIGASANVVGTAIAEKEGYPISWGRYLKYGVVSTILVIGLCWFLLAIRYT